MMHRFWDLPDPQAAMMQQVMFLTNLSMLGGALLISHFGPGPIGLDAQSSVR
jgi:putative oxidoreductase